MAKQKDTPNTANNIVKKNGETVASGITIQNLVIRPVVRSSIEIDKWRNAHQEAEAYNSSRVTLFDMYDDALIDMFLNRLVNKRVLGVIKTNLIYVDAKGQELDHTTDLMNSFAMRQLRREIQLQKAWGITVVELSNRAGALHVFNIPRKHIKPAEGIITTEQYGVDDGTPYRQAPHNQYLVEVGHYNDLGYLLMATACVIYKRGNIADWANFAQIFGMPFREARYDGFNDQVRIQLEQALDKAGSAAYAVLPKEAEFNFHQAANISGSTDLYDKLRLAMNQEMAVGIIGATESTTSSSSSGYAQSETHIKTVDEVAADDRTDELAIFNEKVRPVLINLGLLPQGRFIHDTPMDYQAANALVDMAIKMRNAGTPIDDEWLYETTGIPKPNNYIQLKAQKEQENNQKETPKKNTADKKNSTDQLAAIMQKLDGFFA